MYLIDSLEWIYSSAHCLPLRKC